YFEAPARFEIFHAFEFGRLAFLVTRPPAPALVGGPRHVNRQLQFVRQYPKPGHMVGVLMRDHNSFKPVRVFASLFHALERLAAGDSGIDQDAALGSGNNRAVSPAAAGQHCHAHRHLDAAYRDCFAKGSSKVVTVAVAREPAYGPSLPENSTHPKRTENIAWKLNCAPSTVMS